MTLFFILSAGCSSTLIKEEPTATPPQTTQANPENGDASKFPPCPVDLAKYMTENIEVYAYIYIPGTNISYPVVQSRHDDNYYLRRNWKGKKEGRGCIYSQLCNNRFFTDPVTVLYGHNTADGDMFSDLLKYKDKQFFGDNNTIYVYLPYGVLVYQIFSSHSFDDRHIMNSYDFSKPEVLAEFQQTLLDPPVLEKTVMEDVELCPESQILILSTCGEARSGCKTRYLVNGVLTDYAIYS